MWETKYNEMQAVSSHQEQEIQQLQAANEKGRLSHANVSFSSFSSVDKRPCCCIIPLFKF